MRFTIVIRDAQQHAPVIQKGIVPIFIRGLVIEVTSGDAGAAREPNTHLSYWNWFHQLIQEVHGVIRSRLSYREVGAGVAVGVHRVDNRHLAQ